MPVVSLNLSEEILTLLDRLAGREERSRSSAANVLLRRALTGRGEIGDKAGATAAVRTSGHGPGESEGTGRVESSAGLPRPVSAPLLPAVARGGDLVKQARPFSKGEQAKGGKS